MKNWHPPPCPQLPEQDPPKATVTLPHFRHLSETIRRVWFVFQSAHQPYGQDHGTLLEGAQEGINIKEHSPVRGTEHVVDQMHEINWKKAEVVESHPYYHQRCVLKAWHICMEHQTMNHDENPFHHATTP